MFVAESMEDCGSRIWKSNAQLVAKLLRFAIIIYVEIAAHLVLMEVKEIGAHHKMIQVDVRTWRWVTEC